MRGAVGNQHAALHHPNNRTCVANSDARICSQQHKVGSLIGSMTYGVKKDTSLALFKQALTLNPGSAIGMTEYANGMVMLEGDKRMKEATRLYEQAAACEPLDAMERLDVEMARVELQD